MLMPNLDRYFLGVRAHVLPPKGSFKGKNI